MKIRASVSKFKDLVPREELTGNASKQTRVVGYADFVMNDCYRFSHMPILEAADGSVFPSFPRERVLDENRQQKHYEDGRPIYEYIYCPVGDNATEVRKMIFDTIMAAYNGDKGYAYHNPENGERNNTFIEPQLHKCNDEIVKAAGDLTVCGCMEVRDVFVKLGTRNDNGKHFLAVDHPCYETRKGSGQYRPYAEPLEKGKIWDHEEKAEKDHNYKDVIERVLKKQAKEFHPELVELLKGKQVDELIAGAKAQAEENCKGDEREAMDMDGMQLPF